MANVGYQHIICDPTKCIGCRLCEYACTLTKISQFDPALSRIRVVRIEPITMTAVSCQLCADAPCVLACPRNALMRSEQNGVILVDNDKCDGCGWCVEACDFGAVVINPSTKRAEFCNLCMDQTDGPACVSICPKEALSLNTAEVLQQQVRREAVVRLFEELIAK